MTQPAPDASFRTHALEETFLGVTWRRARYAAAIALSAALFCWLGWMIAPPPPEWAGVSLVTWQSQSYFAAFLLALILLATTALCSLIVHPDSPHMGLFCALLGMAGLSIRGGNVHMLMVYAQSTGSLAHVADGLAMECVEWGLVILLADAFARVFHDRLLANTHWVDRSNPDLLNRANPADRALAVSRLGYAAGVSKTVSGFLRTDKVQAPVRIPLAIFWSGAMAFLILSAFIQTQLKGQVLMSCFMAFLMSTLCAYMAFPTVPFWAFIVTVPLTGAAAYIWGRNGVTVYPGHAPYFAMRALPIDYISAGAPGAILGYYLGFGWALSSAEE